MINHTPTFPVGILRRHQRGHRHDTTSPGELRFYIDNHSAHLSATAMARKVHIGHFQSIGQQDSQSPYTCTAELDGNKANPWRVFGEISNREKTSPTCSLCAPAVSRS
eukprot:scpid110013/ scgid14935/ 